MNKLITKFAFGITALSILSFASPALAANQGQVEGGDIYRIKNLTKNVDYTDPASADKCDLLQYKVRIHDPGPGSLMDVWVYATLPEDVATSNTSAIVITPTNADPATTWDAATVNLSSAQSLSYVKGTTQLLDSNNSLIKTLPDGITQDGVNIGDVGVSIDNREYVQFQVSVSCPTPTPTPKYSCDALNLTVHSGRKVDATVNYTATGGATLKDVSFDWGDGSSPLVTTSTSASHTYNRDGTFTVKATTTFNVGGTQKSTTTDVCTKQVTFSTPPTPPTPTPTPPAGKLPDTGAGSIAGLFAGVSTLAGAVHYMWGRRFGL